MRREARLSGFASITVRMFSVDDPVDVPGACLFNRAPHTSHGSLEGERSGPVTGQGAPIL